MSDSLRDIRLFAAAFEERSFTAAAQREGATQSGVSQHIRKLEDRFGVRLFLRGSGQVVPTPAGEQYYRNCLDVLRAHEEAGQALRGFAQTAKGGGLEGEVVVGLMPTMTRCALAPALAQFLDRHPNVTVRIIEAYSAVLTQMVRAGELAFAVVPAFAAGPGLTSRLFARTPEVLVSAAGASALPHGVAGPVAAQGALRLVLPAPSNTRRQTLDAYLAANGVKIGRVLDLDAMLGTLDLVGSTDWRTILPGVMMAADLPPGRFCINPVAGPGLSLDLVLIEPARCPMAPEAEAFRKLLEAETARASRVWDRGE